MYLQRTPTCYACSHMKATPRNDVVRLRLTTLEKQDWSRAAGGTRRLSEWIRQICNEAAEQPRGGGIAGTPDAAQLEPAGPEAPLPLKTVVVPNAKPVIVGDAIERQVRDEAGSALTAATDAEEVAGPRPAVAKDQAHREPRSMPATEAPGDDSSSGVRPLALSSGDGSGCPRWQHHRPGVYCGSCKRVIGK